MKKIPTILIIGLLTLTLFLCRVEAVTVDETDFINIENETYTFSHEMNFSEINIERTNVTFNLTTFNVSSPNAINIAINQIVNYSIINFTSNVTAPCLVWFNISGLFLSYNYTVLINGTHNQTVLSDADGEISFNHSGNDTILIRSGTSQVRITAEGDAPDVLGVSETVITIIGVVLIIGAIIGIVFAVMKAGWI